VCDPCISIIVPTRCRHHLVGRAINSILAQSFTDFEIIVVDNNPSQSRIVNRQKRPSWLADPRVRVIEDERSYNPAGARNRGLEVARGEWVTYLDDDDAYQPQKLERQLSKGKSSGLPVGVCGTVRRLPGRRRIVNREANEIEGDDLLLYFPGMPTIFHQRAPDVRFNEALDAAEDVHYFQQLVRYYQTKRVFNVRHALVEIYQQPTSHVNLNARAVWQACESILQEFGEEYSKAACAVFRERARLRLITLDRGHLRELVISCAVLLWRHRVRDVRLVLNCFLYKLPWTRQFVVH